MIHEYTLSHGPTLGFEFSGRLGDKDYQEFVPRIDAAIAEFGKVDILIHFHSFDGWDLAGFWRDLRFTTHHYSKVRRFAIIGESAWQNALTQLARPLTGATVRYFSEAQSDEAWNWITNG